MVALSSIRPSKILVIGDVMLDAYTIGKAKRISPEAPVAVVSVVREEERPGGAANVALNLKALGADVLLLSRIGQDLFGKRFLQALENEGISTQNIYTQQGCPTAVKERVIAESQQLVRIDREELIPLDEQLEEEILRSVNKLFEGVSAIAISDYGKGFLTPTLLEGVIARANQLSIPVIVDPKGIDFSKYKGANCIKPNLAEAIRASGLSDDAPLEKMAEKILEVTAAEVLMITRSEAGISLFFKEGRREDYSVKAKQVKDVTGAGDTVLAALSLAVGSKMAWRDAAHLCNLAAGLAIEQFGCAKVSISDVARRLLKEDVGSKIYDREHLFAFSKALEGRPFDLVLLSDEESLRPKFVQTLLREIKKPERDLVICFTHENPSTEALDFVASLQEVLFVVAHREGRKFFEQLELKDVWKESAGKLLVC